MNNMYFAMTNGEPTFDERATEENTHINDIVTFQNNKKKDITVESISLFLMVGV